MTRDQRADQMSRRFPFVSPVVVGLLAVLALLLGLALQPLAVDDAFITYRYAHNLAHGLGFTYNPGRPVLSTTAPLYALLLAGGAVLGLDLPALSNALSALALWLGAVLIFVLGRREGGFWGGALAALLYLLHPLLWLSLGLETAVFMALALGAIVAYRHQRLYLAAALLALATLTRGDGLILAAVLAADYGLRWLVPGLRARRVVRSDLTAGLRPALGVLGVYVAVMLPLLAWLTWQFGSPLPATLGAKVAQAELGITGFYAHTTYLQGLLLLVRARLAQTPLYLLFGPAILVGLFALRRQGRWLLPLVAWGAAHLVGYALLGVTPYYWYYAPLLPALACTSALGVVASARWAARRAGRRPAGWGLGGLWAAALIAALLWSDLAVVRGLEGPLPPPEDPVSKVLPEAKAGPYERAGRWLRDHTPADALVGVTEVGIMGYYARRPMVDFLGLLEPDVAQALARGDLYWALLRYQPDYLALTAISPLYAYDLRADPWFQAAYAPVETVDDLRFWGSPVTIYERQVPRTVWLKAGGDELPADALPLNVDFGAQIRLLGAATADETVQPGDVLGLTLYWQALTPIEDDYTVFVHLLGEHERVIAQRDAPPGLGSQPTSCWVVGQMVTDPHLLALPPAVYAPDQAVWEVGLYEPGSGRLPTNDGRDAVRFGSLSVQPSGEPLHLDFGAAVLTGYQLDRLALAQGESLAVSLEWTGTGPAQVGVQLVDEQGQVRAEAVGDLNRETYRLALPASAPPGAYDLEVIVADPGTEQVLPLLGADRQPQADRARLTKVRLYP